MNKEDLLSEWEQWISAIATKYNLRDKKFIDIFIKKTMPNMFELFEKIKKGEIKV